MLTVKIIQDGITKIYESENFCFYDETSDEYRLALSLADRLNESPVDLTSIFYTQPLFSDENCQETIREEEIYCSARNNSADKIVGVLIDVIPDEQYAFVKCTNAISTNGTSKNGNSRENGTTSTSDNRACQRRNSRNE